MSKFFPLYINIENKNILVVGSGNIAKRRIATLQKFKPLITVISKDFDSFDNMDTFQHFKVELLKKDFQKGDCSNFDMVFACTNDRNTNHNIYLECKEKNITVNVCDNKDECDFFFPAVITDENENVVSVCGNGKSHKTTKHIADNIRALKDTIFKRYNL